MVKEIPLQNGMVALIDDEDYEKVIKYTWSVHTSKGIPMISNAKKGYMSRFIMGVGDSNKIVIFRNGDKFDLRKANLIVGDSDVKNRVRKGNKNSTSKYRGVCWDKSRSKWKATIEVDGRTIHLGRFDNEDTAAKIYNEAALEYFGENAFQNSIGTDNSALEFNFEKGSQKRTKDSEYRGVYKSHLKWLAKCSHLYLGLYDSSTLAAKAYDQKAYELYGDKAILNFPELIEEYKVTQ